MPDDNVIIFVTLTPKSGKEADLEELLRGMCGPSRAEGGCITYNLYQKADGGGAFHFFEIWKCGGRIRNCLLEDARTPTFLPYIMPLKKCYREFLRNMRNCNGLRICFYSIVIRLRRDGLFVNFKQASGSSGFH